jgi:hypothetical protein
MVKAGSAWGHDRAYITLDGDTRRVAVHVLHDLPHLVVESLFDIHDGLWAELATAGHSEANRAVTARSPKLQKLGRIVSGAASGARTDEWLTPGHRVAKTVTNAVTNRFGDGPDTPAGVRARLSAVATNAVPALLARIDDETIETAIRGVRDLERLWIDLEPGAVLRLQWPLSREWLANIHDTTG